MYENSDSQFFRTTTGIQLGSDAFDESRFVMTFLTILGVLKIGKTDEKIPESSRSKLLENF